jgi:hypothetical protein
MGNAHQRRVPRSGIRLSGGLARIIRIPSGGEKRRISEEHMTRPRAADDFEMIRARMEVLGGGRYRLERLDGLPLSKEGSIFGEGQLRPMAEAPSDAGADQEI